MKTSEEVALSAQRLSNVDTLFVWGASGEIISEKVINRGIQIAPERYNYAMVEYLKRFIGKHVWCFDCIGLVKKCADVFEDIPTDELFHLATESGTIETIPNIPGILVYMPNHVGIYIGNGDVIESSYAVGVGFGVVKTKGRPWTHWFKSHWIQY